MKIILKAKSSSFGQHYNVEFDFTDGKLSVFCNCPAGEWGKLCKHKWQLLHGETEMLFDDTQLGELQKIEELARNRNVDSLYEKVTLLEEENKSLAKTQKKEKDKISKKIERSKTLAKEEFVELRSKLIEIENEIEYRKYLISLEKKVAETQLKEGF